MSNREATAGVRSDGSSRTRKTHGPNYPVEPGNEPIHCRWADCGDRRGVKGDDQLKDVAPVVFAKRLLEGEAPSFDVRVERYGIVVELDEGLLSFVAVGVTTKLHPESRQVGGGLEGLPKVEAEGRTSSPTRDSEPRRSTVTK